MPNSPDTKGEILAKVIETLSLELDFHKICNYATSVTMDVLEADYSTMALPVDEGPLRFRYFWGFPPDLDTNNLPNITPGTLNAFKSGQNFYVPDYQNYVGALPDFLRLGVVTGLAAPIRLGEQAIGVLTLAWKRRVDRPTDYQNRLVEAVLRQVAFAFQRETLMKDLSKSRSIAVQLNQRMERVLAVSPAIIYNLRYDPTGSSHRLKSLFISDNLPDILGYSNEYLLEQPGGWQKIIHPDDVPLANLPFKDEKLEKGAFDRVYRIRHQAGHYIWVHDSLRIFPVSEHESEIIGALVDITKRKEDEAELRLHRDHLQELVHERTADLVQAKDAAEKAMREAKQAEEHSRYLALNDALTGLPNRVLLMERLNQALSQSRRSGKKVALLFIDLDRFKNINDSLGHFVGDELLCEVSRRFTHCIRDSDTVSRQGGDEFVILLPEIMERKDVTEIAEKLLAVVSQPYKLEGYEMRVTHSIGISLFPDDGMDAHDLMRKADTAMYRAKEVGRNNYQFFTEDIARTTLSRLSLEVDLRRAIELQEFEVYYQPQIELASRRMIGIEALVRWNHPQLGLLMPSQFITLAEDTGLMSWLGHYVLSTAIGHAAELQARHHIRLPVSINLSAAQLERQDFIQSVQELLAQHQLPASFLKFELTESMLMRNTESINAQLTTLSSMGIQLALDDFGTHYSSLTYLKRFPVDTLKIDRSFVQDIVTDADDAAISRAIISMGHSLGMRIIAEGVETAEQLSMLEIFNCDEAQGSFFGPPVPAGELDMLLYDAKFPLEEYSSRLAPANLKQ